MKKIILLPIFTFVFSMYFAQLLPCGQHVLLKQKLQDSTFRAQFEAEKKIQQQVLQEMLQNPLHKRGTIYTIPIVFHVLHSNGVENITKEQILDQLAILNRDYRLQNPDAKNVQADFKGMPADVQVEFVLATKAPDGTCFSGITRTYTPTLVTDGPTQVSLIMKGNDVYKGDWTGNKYLNVFITAGLNGPAGYTNLPYGNGNSMSNGVYILHNYIGSIGTSSVLTSRALTHEVGHWFNLYHTWGPTNSPGDTTNCGVDDEVADTPNCIGDKEVCNLDDKYCGPRANVENYMEYSYCSKMFTQGQVDRMRAAIISSVGGRNNVWTTQNLTQVGGINPSICKAEFISDFDQTCQGGQIQFKDSSFNSPKTWNWTFPGGTPANSTEQNPTIIYNTPGVYDVTLQVSDGKNSLTTTKSNYISVLGDSKKIPLLETFANYSKISDATFWSVSNPENNQTFEIFTGAGYSDNTCLKLANFLETITNTDKLVSNSIDLSQITNQNLITLTFRYAYRKKASSNSEVFRVSMSSDCGYTWNSRKVLSGGNISNLVSTVDWTPTSSSDWTTVHVTNISSSYWTKNVRLAFEFDGSGGNNFYLDDINLYPSAPSNELVLGVSEAQITDGIKIYPNPTDQELSIEFTLNNHQTINYAIMDITGKVIVDNIIQGANGKNLVLLSTKDLGKGTYFVKMNIGGEPVIKYFQVMR